MKSSKAWRLFGSQNPYFGVLRHERFRGKLDAELTADFFATGETYVASLLERISKLASGWDSALDFGCGVGRLTIPLAGHYRRVAGVDVSPGMLAEMKRNLQAQGVDNVDAFLTIDELEGPFDLVHSYIVLQHIEPKTGIKIISRLCDLVAENGVLAIHITYDWDASMAKKIVYALRRRFPPFAGIVNLLKGCRWNKPMIQMNDYDLPSVFNILNAHGFEEITTRFTNHNRHPGLILYAKRVSRSPAP